MSTKGSRLTRIPEPELMQEKDQAAAYANADFEAAHSVYPLLFRDRFPQYPRRAAVLDLGCGPCDVTVRFAGLSRGWTIHAVDGSRAMLGEARKTLARRRLAGRIRLVHGLLPAARLPRKRYDIILTTSLLHHLPEPQALWQTVRRVGRPGTIVFVADLRRPTTKRRARALVDQHSASEPEVLQRDFYNSLLAAFTPSEVRRQLGEADLKELNVEVLGDRHLIVTGTIQ